MRQVGLNSIISILIALSMLAYALRGKVGAIIISMYIVIVIIEFFRKQTAKINTFNYVYATHILFFAVLINTIRAQNIEYYKIIGYFSAALILFNTRIDFYKGLWKLLKAISIFEAIGTYMQMIMPQCYYFLLSIILPDTVVLQIKSRLLQGYYTGFTREVSYTMFLIVIGLGLYIYDVTENSSIKKDWSRLGAIVFLTGALFISGKRATLLFCFMSIFIIQFLQSTKKQKLIKYAVLGISSFFLLTITYPIWSKISKMQRIVELVKFVKIGDWAGATNGRIAIYETAIKLWSEKKWLGIGWGNFRHLVPQNVWYSGFDVHNCYLQILCETGIIGAFLYYLLTSITIVNLVRCINKAKYLDIQSRKLIIFAGYIQVFFILYSLTEPILYEYPDYIMYFICVNLTSIILKTHKNSVCSSTAKQKISSTYRRTQHGKVIS